ncbi:MAG: citrate transporter, partial [Pyramidobacter sp.]|nr:citrate transporter [Pyramidobacter sp.]
MLFGLSPIWGLLPLLLYIVLAFKKGMHPPVNVAVCVLFGAILTKQPLGSLGAVISKSMGSFLALVGLIIMLGAGLGAVLRKTGVADNIVNILMRRIGVSTQKRAIIATMVCSVVLVTLLGTLAGANAIIAP